MIAAYFQSLGFFDREEITQIVQLFEYRTLNKNDFFVKENQPCNEVAFIASGIFRSYYSTSSAEDVTYCFRFPKGLRIQQSGINGCKKSNTSDKNMDKTHLISR